MKIYVINEYKSSSQMYGGRNRFLIELYKNNPDISFVEIAVMKKDTPIREEYFAKNTKYIWVKKIADALEIVKEAKFVYLHSYRKNLKKFRKTYKGEIILQQHFNFTYYKKSLLRKVDTTITYTEADAKLFGRYCNTKPIYMGAILEPKEIKHIKPLYSGGPDKKSIKKILSITNNNLIIDVTERGYSDILKTFKGENIFVRSSKHENIYDDASCYVQVSNKGYSLSAIEALSRGVPTFFLNNSVAYSELVIDESFLCNSLKEMKEKISKYKLSESDIQKCYALYKNNFYKSNDQIVKYLIENS